MRECEFLLLRQEDANRGRPSNETDNGTSEKHRDSIPATSQSTTLDTKVKVRRRFTIVALDTRNPLAHMECKVLSFIFLPS